MDGVLVLDVFEMMVIERPSMGSCKFAVVAMSADSDVVVSDSCNKLALN
jgi:hypothetical protein